MLALLVMVDSVFVVEKTIDFISNKSENGDLLKNKSYRVIKKAFPPITIGCTLPGGKLTTVH